jgi:predicted ATPase
MIGRAEDIAEIVTSLRETRFVSVVGAGGIGKTVVAIAVAHFLLPQFDDDAVFVDLSTVTSEECVDIAIAAALSVAPQSDDIMSEVVAYVRNRRMLLVLDNCEHVIGSASAAAERLFAEAPNLFIVTTSREALRAEGENVYRLGGLGYPPNRPGLTADQALKWPAVQLFMDRAATNGHRDALTDDQVPAVVSICDRLDGVALAIELAASRVASHGIVGTSELLNHRFKMMWRGRRSAVHRHQTLNAVLDWSYKCLGTVDQIVLARLAVFLGSFTVAAAEEVASDNGIDPLEVVNGLVGLAEKSLIRADNVNGEIRYRLLDITRTYAAAKLDQSGERASVARRHANYVAARLVVIHRSYQPGEKVVHDDIVSLMANLLVALKWSFSDRAEYKIAVQLVGLAVPLLLRHSLLKECEKWCGRALPLLVDTQRGSEIELTLWEGLAVSEMFTRGNREVTQYSIERCLSLAQELGSDEQEIRLLSAMHIFRARIGDVHGTQELSCRALKLAERTSRDDLLAMTEWMQGTTYHLSGDQVNAQLCCESAFRRSACIDVAQFNALGYDHRIRGLIVLVRALWIRGFLDQATQLAHDVIVEATVRGQPVALCVALIYTTTIAIWSQDLDTADRQIERIIGCAEENSLEPYRAVGIAMRGEVSVLRGHLDVGIADLNAALSILRNHRHGILSTEFVRALSEGLAANGQSSEALANLDGAISRAEANGELYLLPDMYRARGEVLAQGSVPDLEGAEDHLVQAIAVARRQSEKGWELRATISLARLLLAQGRAAEAAMAIEATINGIDEGREQPIMKSAHKLLAEAKHVHG